MADDISFITFVDCLEKIVVKCSIGLSLLEAYMRIPYVRIEEAKKLLYSRVSNLEILPRDYIFVDSDLQTEISVHKNELDYQCKSLKTNAKHMYTMVADHIDLTTDCLYVHYALLTIHLFFRLLILEEPHKVRQQNRFP